MSDALLADPADYGVSLRTGFVPDTDPLVAMPAAFAPVEEIAAALPGLLRKGSVRRAIRAMPEPDSSLATTLHEQERLFLALSILTNAWVWGGDEPDLRVPANLARPVSALARALGRQPIASYASLACWNWRRIDADEPPSADNAELLLRFLGGVDESWFFVIPLGIELAGAAALAPLLEAVRAAAAEDETAAETALARAADRIPAINTTLVRIREWCAPQSFFTRILPWLAGWPAPGAIYEGVSEAPLLLAAGSAAQSALIPAFDAALGIAHSGTAAAFLADMRRYMPAGHRAFLADLAATSRLRHFVVASARPGLSAAYDEIVAQLDMFRRRHMGLVMDYVVQPSGAGATAGSGDTNVTGLLRDTRVDTASARLGGS